MALEVLGGLPGGRKFAVLGDMRELGPAAEQFHREIGEQAARIGLERLVDAGRVGPRHRRGRAGRAWAERAEWAADNERAAERLLALLGPGDVVLVKGSRAMGMEEIVRRLASG